MGLSVSSSHWGLALVEACSAPSCFAGGGGWLPFGNVSGLGRCRWGRRRHPIEPAHDRFERTQILGGRGGDRGGWFGADLPATRGRLPSGVGEVHELAAVVVGVGGA